MKVKKVKSVKDLLEANGWKYSRTKGDHAIYRKGRCSSLHPNSW